MTKNKFINNSGSTGSPGSTGSAILKFIIGVGLILGVCAFVMVLTTKCKCKDKFTATALSASNGKPAYCYDKSGEPKLGSLNDGWGDGPYCSTSCSGCPNQSTLCRKSVKETYDAVPGWNLDNPCYIQSPSERDVCQKKFSTCSTVCRNAAAAHPADADEIYKKCYSNCRTALTKCDKVPGINLEDEGGKWITPDHTGWFSCNGENTVTDCPSGQHPHSSPSSQKIGGIQQAYDDGGDICQSDSAI